MTAQEKLLLIMWSVLASTLVNILMNRLMLYVKDTRTVKNAKKGIPLYCESIRTAITNGITDEIGKYMSIIISDYGVVSSMDKKLAEDMESLHSFCLFALSGGYATLPERKTKDIDAIDSICLRYRKHS